MSGAAASATAVVYRAINMIGLVGVGWICAGVLAAQDRRNARQTDSPELSAEQASQGQPLDDGS